MIFTMLVGRGCSGVLAGRSACFRRMALVPPDRFDVRSGRTPPVQNAIVERPDSALRALSRCLFSFLLWTNYPRYWRMESGPWRNAHCAPARVRSERLPCCSRAGRSTGIVIARSEATKQSSRPKGGERCPGLLPPGLFDPGVARNDGAGSAQSGAALTAGLPCEAHRVAGVHIENVAGALGREIGGEIIDRLGDVFRINGALQAATADGTSRRAPSRRPCWTRRAAPAIRPARFSSRAARRRGRPSWRECRAARPRARGGAQNAPPPPAPVHVAVGREAERFCTIETTCRKLKASSLALDR